MAALTLAFLGKEQIRLLGRRQIRHAVAGVKHDGPRRQRRVLANLERLVVAVDAVVVKDNLPAAGLVDAAALGAGRDVVADNLHVPARAEHLVEQGADDGLHAAAEDDDGDVVRLRPAVKVLEARVELDVGEEQPQALVKGRLHAVEHAVEHVAKVGAAGEHLAVVGLALGRAAAQVVNHVVVGVGRGDCAVKVGEEDELGVGGQRRRVGVEGAHDGWFCGVDWAAEGDAAASGGVHTSCAIESATSQREDGEGELAQQRLKRDCRLDSVTANAESTRLHSSTIEGVPKPKSTKVLRASFMSGLLVDMPPLKKSSTIFIYSI